METIRRYIGDFRLSKAISTLPRLRNAAILSTPELVMVSFMGMFGAIYFLSADFGSLGGHLDLNRTKLFETSSDSSQKNAAATQSLGKKNLDLIAALKDRYSFKKASAGFYLSDLSFLEKDKMEAIEEQLTLGIPKRMRARAKKYVRPVLLLSEKHQIDPFWVMSIMWTESHFQPKAQSHVGARGLMQLMPKTKAWIYNRYRNQGNRLVVENHMLDIHFFFNKNIKKASLGIYKKKLINIELGIIYLKYLLKKFDNNHKLATVAYNMGPGWTRYRLRNKLPVGVKNLYLSKVEKAYQSLSNRI